VLVFRVLGAAVSLTPSAFQSAKSAGLRFSERSSGSPCASSSATSWFESLPYSSNVVTSK